MIMCGLLGITVYWAGDRLLDAVWEPLNGWSWLLAPLAVFLFLLWRSRLAFRAHPAQPGRKALLIIGLANSVTLCRGLLICGLGGFAFSSQLQGVLTWVPCVIYASSFAADGLDGLIARARGEDSPVGEVLDREVDALGVFIAAILAYQYGRLPAFFLPVSAAYYIFNLAIWLRMKHGKPVHPLRPSRFRRAVGALQAFSLTLFLAPLLSPLEGFGLAVALTLAVSLSFVKDWMAVIGAHWRLRRRSGA
jgi:CDP-diacylglycerol---glycerol-3-phosphate 3-phosphatidyltransferase